MFFEYFPDFRKLKDYPLKNLSSGQCRLIETYTILLAEAQFCVLDEPFGQLMPLHIETLKEILLLEKRNKGIIITDHMYRHVIDITTEGYVLKNGITHLMSSIQNLEKIGYISNLKIKPVYS